MSREAGGKGVWGTYSAVLGAPWEQLEGRPIGWAGPLATSLRGDPLLQPRHSASPEPGRWSDPSQSSQDREVGMGQILARGGASGEAEEEGWGEGPSQEEEWGEDERDDDVVQVLQVSREAVYGLEDKKLFWKELHKVVKF